MSHQRHVICSRATHCQLVLSKSPRSTHVLTGNAGLGRLHVQSCGRRSDVRWIGDVWKGKRKMRVESEILWALIYKRELATTLRNAPRSGVVLHANMFMQLQSTSCRRVLPPPKNHRERDFRGPNHSAREYIAKIAAHHQNSVVPKLLFFFFSSLSRKTRSRHKTLQGAKKKKINSMG